MNNETLFLGKPVSYWIELQKQVDRLNATKLIEQLAVANAKVHQYEQAIDELNEFRKITNKLKV